MLATTPLHHHCEVLGADHGGGYDAEPRPAVVSGLRRVPCVGGQPIAPEPLGEPPAMGPVDEMARARLRRTLVEFFGDFPTLDHHLHLLDARGAWYAAGAIGAWTREHPDSFFGLVRHVVRTQLPGPAPMPDLEGWIAAGIPTSDPALERRWREIHALRYPADQRPAEVPRARSDAAIGTTDVVVANWPDEHWDAFVLAYVKLEQVLERRSIVLPPIGN